MRPFNFGAGPAMLPQEVIETAKENLLNWNHTGVSMLELGHRTPDFIELLEETEALLRALLSISSEYHVLFLGTPARFHFGMIPLNFLNPKKEAGYLITGLWSSLAFKEALRVGRATCIASSEEVHFQNIPKEETWKLPQSPAYVYYTPNETVNGVRVDLNKTLSQYPLVADMTSCLLTEPLDINAYDLIFAGAQKNIANAGLTIVIIKDAFLKTIENESLLTYLDYRTHVQHRSLYATPPTFNCYIAKLMFDWIQKKGGVSALYKENCEKSSSLYAYLDASSFYHAEIRNKSDRSLTNVCFRMVRNELEETFLKEAEQEGLLNLRGHKTHGGLRASLYNAMPLDGVKKLIAFMDDFASGHIEKV